MSGHARRAYKPSAGRIRVVKRREQRFLKHVKMGMLSFCSIYAIGFLLLAVLAPDVPLWGRVTIGLLGLLGAVAGLIPLHILSRGRLHVSEPGTGDKVGRSARRGAGRAVGRYGRKAPLFGLVSERKR